MVDHAAHAVRQFLTAAGATEMQEGGDISLD
jgi:hypothetical protein